MDSQAPHVHLWSVLPTRDEQLGGSVLWTATVGLQQAARLLGVAQAKVLELRGGNEEGGGCGRGWYEEGGGEGMEKSKQEGEGS